MDAPSLIPLFSRLWAFTNFKIWDDFVSVAFSDRFTSNNKIKYLFLYRILVFKEPANKTISSSPTISGNLCTSTIGCTLFDSRIVLFAHSLEIKKINEHKFAQFESSWMRSVGRLGEARVFSRRPIFHGGGSPGLYRPHAYIFVWGKAPVVLRRALPPRKTFLWLRKVTMPYLTGQEGIT